MPTPAEQIAQLEIISAGLEAQRALLGDALVDNALAPLRRQLAELRQAAALRAAGVSFEGERKLVTIMFADISGFTAMSERMDPEQVRTLMNACFDQLVPVIQKYDGTVDKFIGDEIMALFGAPVAHENDAERALRVALEMMEHIQDFNTQRGTDLGLHLGINTGLVIAGGIGSQQLQQYSVMGDAVNLAARLEDASDRGEIFAGPDTYRMTAPLFEFETLEPIYLKGKSEPVPIYRLLRAKTQPGRVRGLAGLTSPIVGRQVELARLLETSAAASAGTGGAVAVVGEPGLGKSRLVSEWRAAAGRQPPRDSEQPALWAEGHSLSYGQGLAYHLLIDLVRGLLGVPQESDPAEILAALERLADALLGEEAHEIVPYLAHFLSLPLQGEAIERVQALDPPALQSQYLAALRLLLRALADRGPLVLILEDIHWTDPSSTDLLIKLLPLADEAPVLFCALTRPETDTHGWRWVTAAREMLGERLMQIDIGPLDETHSRELVGNLLEVESLPERIGMLILQKAEGNPFFVEEVIRMLIDRGGIVRRDDHWAAVQGVEAIDIPANLQGLLMARIDRLPEEVKRTLRVASVIGRQFAVGVLDQVLQA